jgi:hypothetical protein
MSRPSAQTVVEVTEDYRKTGHIRLHFNEVICDLPPERFPIVCHADQVVKYDLDELVLPGRIHPVAVALFEILVFNGYTGVFDVSLSSKQGMRVHYDPNVYKHHLLLKGIRSTVRYVNKHGWVSKGERMPDRQDVIGG